MYYGWGGWHPFFWLVGGVLLVVGLVVIVLWVTSSSRHPAPPPPAPRDPSRPTPEDILRERFARGEITEEEFERARKVLGPDR